MTPRVLGTLLLTFALAGCTGSQDLLPDPDPVVWLYPNYATVASGGATIYNEEGGWKLNYRNQIKPPFKSDIHLFLVNPKVRKPDGPRLVKTWSKQNPPPHGAMTRWPTEVDARKAVRDCMFKQCFFEFVPFAPEPPITLEELKGKRAEYMEKGAVKVRVKYPKVRTPLYGVLALGPALRSGVVKESWRTYDIKIPKSDVRRALEGEVVLVCDPYWGAERVKGKRYVKPGPFQSIINEEDFYAKRRVRSASWVLWLSKKPFD